MFQPFFYMLREHGVPVRPTDFLRLQKALAAGLVTDLAEFYTVARSLLVKSERFFDRYDVIFANYFEGREIPEGVIETLAADLEKMLAEWLADPKIRPDLTEEERAKLAAMTPDEVMEYFRERLKDQTKRHDGGDRWIGTGGRSPVGHGGVHPGGMRVGGGPGNRSAIKVAMDRRYIDYSDSAMLTPDKIGAALDRLRHLVPHGPRDELNIEASIRETVRQGGEIDLVFDRRLVDKLKIFIFLDNGGWSMTPYVHLTRSLFTYARSQFKSVRFFYFHNCIYDLVFEDPTRYEKPVSTAELLRRSDPDTRVVIVGDASMAPYELTHPRGAIEYDAPQSASGLQWVRRVKETFAHAVWINPIPKREWDFTYGNWTVDAIRRQVPMYELTIRGLEDAVDELKSKYPKSLPPPEEFRATF
ncbi:hypothetical protein K8I61_03135 [bacterium]|nr:hypothetical protein [bacterium]